MARKKHYQHGSLFQRGKRNKVWVARWWEDVVDSKGQPVRVRRSEILGTAAEFPNRRMAERALVRRLERLNSEHHTLQSQRKFASFVQDDWSPVVLPTLKYATQKSYRYFLGVHLVPALGELALVDISREIIQALLNQKLASGLAWETVHHLQCALSKVLGTAVEWGFIELNPVRMTKLPRRSRVKRRNVLTPDQIRRLVPALREPSRSLVLLLATTGLRIGELLALRWRNVELDSGLLRIEETVYDGHFDEPKSKHSARLVPLGPVGRAVLAGRVDERSSNGDQLVFTSSVGTPLDRRLLLARQLKPVAKALDLGKVSWHTLRHSNATLHDSIGTPLGTLQALLGHSSSEITRQVYLHSLSEDRRTAVAKLEAVLFGPKLDPSLGFREFLLPAAGENAGDVGRGDRI